MSSDLPSRPSHSNPPHIDYPGPPREDGTENGQQVTDKRQQVWRWADGAWMPTYVEKMVYVVVDAPGVFEMPRAWAFETEAEAVEFRLQRLNDTNRRPRSCQPVLKVPLGNTAHGGYSEIDWKKYPAPRREDKQKKFT